MYLSMLKKCFAMGVVALVMSMSTAVEAAPISTLFNTGVDAGGGLLSQGDLDPHWNVVTSADAGFSTPGPAITMLGHPAWLPVDATNPNSNWIGVNDEGAVAVENGDYVFETTFDLTGLDPSTATISGVTSPDDRLDQVFLNGAALGINSNNFGVFKPFTIPVGSNFIAGVNTLQFVMRNLGAIPGTSPFGLRVELSGTADVIPEPSSLLLTALGLLGMAGFRRRRHSK